MNVLKTTLLLSAMTGLMLLVGYAAGGKSGILIALLFAAGTNFFAYFFSDRLVLSSSNAQPVSRAQAPDFYAIVERLAAKAGIPMPRLYVIPDPALNAFATGRSPSHAAVAATSGILEAMNQEELEGVLGHELSHVLNRDTLTSTVAATLAGAISYLAYMATWFGGARRDDDDDGPGPLAGLLLVFLGPLAAFLIQMWISRSREYAADESGARLVGHPQGLASALKRLEAAAGEIPLASANPATAHLYIVNPLSSGFLSRLYSTHPPLEKRIERLMSLRI